MKCASSTWKLWMRTRDEHKEHNKAIGHDASQYIFLCCVCIYICLAVSATNPFLDLCACVASFIHISIHPIETYWTLSWCNTLMKMVTNKNESIQGGKSHTCEPQMMRVENDFHFAPFFYALNTFQLILFGQMQRCCWFCCRYRYKQSYAHIFHHEEIANAKLVTLDELSFSHVKQITCGSHRVVWIFKDMQWWKLYGKQMHKQPHNVTHTHTFHNIF